MLLQSETSTTKPSHSVGISCSYDEYTFERIALVQTILNGSAAALVAALKAEESYMLQQIYDDITYVPPGITLQDACQNMCDKAKHLNIGIGLHCGLHLPLNRSSSLSYT